MVTGLGGPCPLCTFLLLLQLAATPSLSLSLSPHLFSSPLPLALGLVGLWEDSVVGILGQGVEWVGVGVKMLSAA